MVDGSMLTLTQEDHNIFKALNTHCSDIKKVVAVLTGKKKKGTVDTVEDDEMDMDSKANKNR